MTSSNVTEYKVRTGKSYTVNVSKNVAGGGTLNLHIDNPSNSGSRCVITSIKITTTGPFDVVDPRDFTVDSTGASHNIYNRALGSGENTSPFNVYKDSTWSSATDEHVQHLANSAGAAAGHTDENVNVTLFEEGDVIIELQNRDGATAHDASVTARFYETSTSNPGGT